MEIFRKCHPNAKKIKQTKEDKNFQIYNFYLLKCPIRLSRTRVALIQDFYVNFYIEFKPSQLNMTLLQKTKTYVFLIGNNR